MTKKKKKHYRKPRPVIPSVDKIFSTLELADIALKKLYHDESLTDAELAALFESDYVTKSVSAAAQTEPKTLYVAASEIAPNFGILFPNVEAEMLVHFSRHPEDLLRIPSRKFEELVAAVFRNNGYEVELTPKTRDGGVDIIAVERKILTGTSVHLIECKRYSPDNKVGIGVLQRMLGVVTHRKANKGIIVTTSSFSRDAIAFAESTRYQLSLSDYFDLSEWLKRFSN